MTFTSEPKEKSEGHGQRSEKGRMMLRRTILWSLEEIETDVPDCRRGEKERTL